MKRITCLYLALLCLFTACQNNENTSDEKQAKEIEFNLPEGFILEDLFSPNEDEHKMGSWVSLAEAPNKMLYACDQRGHIYKFKMPEKGQTLNPAQIEKLDLNIGHAHGLLWAFNSLYVAVNKGWPSEDSEEAYGDGIYRLKDTDNDGKLDQTKLLLKLNGAGEHGPHNFALDPKGEYLYFLAGNHVNIPEVLTQKSRLPSNWGEDNVFEPYLDARGHANDVEAPGGWIARTNSEGEEWELVSAGFRNPFDLTFNKDGELFTYDADMEWDIGMPWYRPTRVCHVTSGSEYGWRTGSGKWPDYYPDNLPAVINLEQGSPTGILMGDKLNFPAKYKDGLFIMDWSFGTIYFITMQEKGSTYSGSKEEFLSGTPLPLTDIIAGSDGNMYFATGGRGLKSHLYRLSYTGTGEGINTSVAKAETTELRKLRQTIEQYHSKKSKEAIPLAWNNLDHPDRFIRYAARIALEHQATEQWNARFFKESNPQKVIQASIALARQENARTQSKILNKLNLVNWQQLNDAQKVDLLRAYNLVNIRMGMPKDNIRRAIIKKLNPHWPSANLAIDRELGQLMQYLKAEDATQKLVQLLEKHTKEKTANTKNMLSTDITERSEQYGPLIREVLEKLPPSEAIFYGVLLSHTANGWTEELRSKYFQWFYDVMSAKGGLSFKPFMENVRIKAMSHVPEAQKKKYEVLSGVFSPMAALEDLPEPIGPGKAYTASDIHHIVGSGLRNYKGKIADGKRAFGAAMCSACHRMRGEGNNTGPDLTQAHTKFSNYDMTFAIFSPNDAISDQYAYTLFQLKDGKKMAGKIVSETEAKLTINPNPYNPSHTVEIVKNDVTKRELSAISPMPPGLLNRLNEQEIIDLFAYLRSGGDAEHKLYKEDE